NFFDIGKSSHKVAATIDLLEAPLQEIDIPENPIDLPEAPLRKWIFQRIQYKKLVLTMILLFLLYEEFYSFISKSQSNKGKQPVNFENEELTNQENDFNSPEALYENINLRIEPIDLNKGFV
ncbi:1892_t:CDS:2, partial [Gigaspora rosea]